MVQQRYIFMVFSLYHLLTSDLRIKKKPLNSTTLTEKAKANSFCYSFALMLTDLNHSIFTAKVFNKKL